MKTWPKLSRRGWLSIAMLLAMLVIVIGILSAPLVKRYQIYSLELIRDGRALQQLRGVEFIQNDISALSAEFERRNLAGWVYSEGLNETQLEVQRRVSDVLSSTGAQIRRVSPLQPRQQDEFNLVGVSVHFTGSLSAVIAALGDLEQGSPLLLFDDVRLTPANVRARRGEPEVQAIDAQLSVLTLVPVAAEEVP